MVDVGFSMTQTDGLSMEKQTDSHAFGADDRILVAEDDSVLCDLICEILGEVGVLAEGVGSGEAAVSRFADAADQGGGFVAAIVDFRLPDMSGLETLHALRALSPTARLIGISGGRPDAEGRTSLESIGGYFLAKPFGLNQLIAALKMD